MVCGESNNNEKIEVHDASILRSNEHPKFKIGDVINNGCVDFIVKGFTRSFMGLSYVLDNGHKLNCWLTEKVDNKFRLADTQPKQLSAPEKIYIDCREHWRKSWTAFTTKAKGDDIEYIRKDAFIEAVANWMSDNLQTVSEVETPSAHHVESIPILGIITQTEFIEKFKKEIMFLLD